MSTEQEPPVAESTYMTHIRQYPCAFSTVLISLSLNYMFEPFYALDPIFSYPLCVCLGLSLGLFVDNAIEVYKN